MGIIMVPVIFVPIFGNVERALVTSVKYYNMESSVLPMISLQKIFYCEECCRFLAKTFCFCHTGLNMFVVAFVAIRGDNTKHL